MTNGQNVARARHLEDVANASKRYILAEILDVTNAVANELQNIGGASYADFTGATSIAGGSSGLVPAPHAGDENKFLRGDGAWATVSSGDPQVVIAGGSVALLDTVPVTVDGGLWCELSGNNIHVLKLRKGNYEYTFNPDRTEFVGDASDALTAYLPFTTSTTADSCGNTWTETGSPAIVDGVLSLDGSSCLVNNTVAPLIASSKWTIDFWATAQSGISSDACFFGFFNGVYDSSFGTSGSYPTDGSFWVCWRGGAISFDFFQDFHVCNLSLAVGERHYYAVTYDGTTVRGFVDGVLKYTQDISVTLGGNFVIGAASWQGLFAKASIEHFRIFNNFAIWTTDFTPPTASDYA